MVIVAKMKRQTTVAFFRQQLQNSFKFENDFELIFKKTPLWLDADS